MAVDKDLFGTLPPLRKPSVLDTYLKAETAERIQQREDEMVFGYNKVKADMVREIMYGGARNVRKTFAAKNALVQGTDPEFMRSYNSKGDIVYTYSDPQVTLDGEPVDTIKFDMNLFNVPTYTHSFTPENITYEEYKARYTYDIKTTLNPTMYKDLAKAYLGFARQTVPVIPVGDLADGTEQPQEPEFGENPCTKVFIYSERTNRMYKDRMVFWLKNPFKDDILACAETNS